MEIKGLLCKLWNALKFGSVKLHVPFFDFDRTSEILIGVNDVVKTLLLDQINLLNVSNFSVKMKYIL